MNQAYFGYDSLGCPARCARYANLIAETLPTRVRGDFAKEGFVAATAAATLARFSAGKPGLDAVASRLAGQPETGQRHSYKAASESLQGLPPGYGPGHTSGQLIEFVVHNSLLFFLYDLVLQGMGPRYDA